MTTASGRPIFVGLIASALVIYALHVLVGVNWLTALARTAISAAFLWPLVLYGVRRR